MRFSGFCAAIAVLALAADPALALDFGDVHPKETADPVGDLPLPASAAADPASMPELLDGEVLLPAGTGPEEPGAPVEPDLAFPGIDATDPVWQGEVLAGETALAAGLSSPGSLPPPRSTLGQSDETCLALAIYHESRGESEAGREAVASVVLQRAAVPGRWGDTICEVVSPVMFSFVEPDFSLPAVEEAEAWEQAEILARRMIAKGPLLDLAGADHYHADYAHPSWRHAMKRVGQIGGHIFYADPLSRPTL